MAKSKAVKKTQGKAKPKRTTKSKVKTLKNINKLNAIGGEIV